MRISKLRRVLAGVSAAAMAFSLISYTPFNWGMQSPYVIEASALEVDGYTTDSNRIMSYKVVSDNRVDLHGYFGGEWKQVTYYDSGFQSCLRVGDTKYDTVNVKGESETCGLTVKFEPVFVNDGKLIQLVYNVRNNSDAPVTFDFAIGADVQIGDCNDAPINMLDKTKDGQGTGFLMESTSDTAGFILIMNGAKGANASDFWYDKKRSFAVENNMFSSVPLNNLPEGIDSVATVSWKNRTAAPGETVSLSCYMGIGSAKELKALSKKMLGTTTEYTITLNYQDGVTDNEDKKTEGGVLTSLPEPTREGYTFKGWFDAETGGNEVTIETTFSKDTTIYAQWLDNNLQGAVTYLESAKLTAVVGDTTGTKYVFSDIPELSQAEIDAGFKYVYFVYPNEGMPPEEWKSFVAKRNNGIKNKEYDRYNNFVGLSQMQDIPTDNTITVTTLSAVPLYKINSHKYVDEYGEQFYNIFAEIDFAVGKEAVSTGNTIKLNANGGTLSGADTATTNASGTFDSLPAEPTREGYTFGGWYTDATKGTKVTKSTQLEDGATIYAQWLDDLQGAVTYLESAKLTAVVGDTTGTKYVFSDIPELSQAEIDAGFKYVYQIDTLDYSYEEISSLADEMNNELNTNLIPRRRTSAKSSGIKDIPEDNTITVEYLSIASLAKINVNAHREGDADSYYCFAIKYFPAGKVAAPIEYTITLKYQDDKTADTTAKTTNGKLTSLPTPTRDGYTFKGWFDAETGGKEVTTATVFEQNTTIYAQWEAVSAPENKAEQAAEDITTALSDITPTNDTTKDGIQAIVNENKGDTTATVTTFELTPATEDKEGSLKVVVTISDGTNTETVTKTYTIEKLSEEGGIIVDNSNNYSGAGIANAEQAKSVIPVTDDEKAAIENGENLYIILDVKDGTATVPTTDRTAVNTTASEYSLTVGMMLDIELFKRIGDGGLITAIHETNGMLPVEFTMPAELLSTDSTVTRTYKIIRVHNGVSDVLECTFDPATGKASFKTDKFSTYAIAYVDTTNTKPVMPAVQYPINLGTDGRVHSNATHAAASDKVTITVDPGYIAHVFSGSTKIARITGTGSFIMPANGIKIVVECELGGYMLTKARSYVYSYDSSMNYITVNATKNQKSTVTINLGKEYAGKSFIIYQGKKSTSVKVTEGTLDKNGKYTLEIDYGKNYTLVVED